MEKGETTSILARPQHTKPAKYSAIAVRTDREVFLEGILGGWDYGRLVGLSVGRRFQSTEFSIGRVYLLNPQPSQLRGRHQFLLSAGIVKRFKNYSIGLRCKHVSNGHREPTNKGVDFWAFGISSHFP